MDTVTVSPKFQVVIPKDVREDLKIKAGEKLAIIEKEGTIHLIPVGKMKDARGFIRIRGITSKELSQGLRDHSERFD